MIITSGVTLTPNTLLGGTANGPAAGHYMTLMPLAIPTIPRGKTHVHLGEHVPCGIHKKRNYHTDSICNKSIRMLLNPYKLLHDSERVLHTFMAIFGRNNFPLLKAYSALVERPPTPSSTSSMSPYAIIAH